MLSGLCVYLLVLNGIVLRCFSRMSVWFVVFGSVVMRFGFLGFEVMSLVLILRLEKNDLIYDVRFCVFFGGFCVLWLMSVVVRLMTFLWCLWREVMMVGGLLDMNFLFGCMY